MTTKRTSKRADKQKPVKSVFFSVARLPIPEIQNNSAFRKIFLDREPDSFELYAVNYGLADGSVIALVPRDGVFQVGQEIKNLLLFKLSARLSPRRPTRNLS